MVTSAKLQIIVRTTFFLQTLSKWGKTQMNHEEYPLDLQKLLQAAYHNGFGFQADGVEPKGYLVIAFLSRDNEAAIHEDAETKIWQSDLQTDQLKIDEWLGRTFVQVHWTLYSRIPEILQYAVNHGFNVLLRSRFDIYFKVGDKIDTSLFEETFIAQLKWRAENMRFSFQEFFKIGYHRQWQFFCPWNWQTETGKSFCDYLRKTLPDEIDADADQCNFYQWKGTSDTILRYCLWNLGQPEPALVPEQKQPEKKTHIAVQVATFHVCLHHPVPNKPRDMCILCEEREANTKVLPCEDVVVCLECSNQLKNTPDRAICIKCRRPIEMILADGQEPRQIY
jgi:hypothetical protein